MSGGDFSGRALERARRGGAWLAGRLNADGSLGHGAGIRTMYKALAALTVTGELVAAQRLAGWLHRAAQRSPGVFEHPDPNAPANQNLYTDSWILLGMQRLGRFDVATSQAIDRVAGDQTRAGGFSMAPAGAEVRPLDPTSTSLAGIVLLGSGCVAEAKQAGEFLINLMESQPAVGEAFYFLTDPQTCSTITREEPNQGILCRINYQEPKQLFFHLGAPAVFLTDLARATGAERFLEAAGQYVAAAGRIGERGRSFTCACKCAWGAAHYYAASGDEEADELARSVAGSVFLDTQNPDGSWPPATIVLSDDYTTTRILSSEEITAEFVYELASAAGDLA